jgi:hypothetical protein
LFWISARICHNSVLHGELHRIFPTLEKFNLCPISTTVPSPALELFKSAPFLMLLQCGAYLFSANAPDSTIVKMIASKALTSINILCTHLKFSCVPCTYVIILCHHPTSSSYVISYIIILPDSDLYIQGHDENLITIGNKPVFPQSRSLPLINKSSPLKPLSKSPDTSTSSCEGKALVLSW